ncbi:sporulation YhaL family protein [Bacillus aquiflavi]|uniref:Sporulation YhaL family protein n=1 Tax=Bacillus aquiflavi TaxID=2672567 RepID=A0A6B3VWZ1_9BACI|nr:sporulation YhaL family protein [Bacillus aquiflavi]MBA4535665.1 sporulation YhaL family protein [Bacillus aquiflavi]NEY80041.1 hypothetical protein [Bacillus aquiflavi]UAC48975.1 sporulation YhaL family protein [Bacillus aquiflavi]
MAIPIWIYFVLAGIAVSAYMTIKTAKEEKQRESELIEQEGEVYMHRLEEERTRKLEQASSETS